MAMEVWERICPKRKWLFHLNSDQPENAKYNEIDGNDVIQ